MIIWTNQCLEAGRKEKVEKCKKINYCISESSKDWSGSFGMLATIRIWGMLQKDKKVATSGVCNGNG
jgi:hypothetical protein